MKFRDWVNNNSAVVTIAAVVVLILSLAFIVFQASGHRVNVKPVDVYYFDLGNGQLFLKKSNEIPPVEAPSGPFQGHPGGVRAYVFSCGDCSDAKQRFVGWLEMYTPDAKEAMQNPERMRAAMPGAPTSAPAGGPGGAGGPPPGPSPMGPEFFDLWERGHLVRTVEEDKWVQANSAEGFQIMQQLQGKCGPGVIPKPCFPGR